MNHVAPRVSVVVPCLNEGTHLEKSLETISDELSFLDGKYELLVIDDGSSDDTWEIICGCAEKNFRIRGLRLSRRFGKELAMTAGLERARGDAVIVMDADLQHPPSVIPEMVRYWEEEGYDVVEAVKEKRGHQSIVSRIEATLFNSLLGWISKIDLRRASDFKLMDRKVLNAWMEMPERAVFFRGMSAWLGFRRKSLPFTAAARAGGQTNWSHLGLLRLALTGIIAFSSVPIHLVTLTGGLFLLFATVLGINTFWEWYSGVAVEGFTTVIILQLFIASMLMTSLGIIGTYISKIYEEVKGRPRYILFETTESTDIQVETSGGKAIVSNTDCPPDG